MPKPVDLEAVEPALLVDAVKWLQRGAVKCTLWPEFVKQHSPHFTLNDPARHPKATLAAYLQVRPQSMRMVIGYSCFYAGVAAIVFATYNPARGAPEIVGAEQLGLLTLLSFSIDRLCCRARKIVEQKASKVSERLHQSCCRVT